MTRYFKNKDGSQITSTSTGNRSKHIPSQPSESWKWFEIDKNEFYRLKRKILKVKK